MGNSETALKFEELELDRSKGQVHEDWNILPGKLRGLDVTVFSAVHPLSSKKRPYIEKALQASKIYRHPGILKYVEGGFLGNEIIVVTEEATPLLSHNLENMSFLQITAGLASIIEALAFLHDKAGVSHNNVSSSSIYVTSDGIWKLWGMEYLCSFGELTRDHIEKINQYCSDKIIPPEDKTRISPAYQHARDCYSFGKFIVDVIAPVISFGSDEDSAEAFLSFIKSKVLHDDWTKRPRLSTFFEHSFFQHEFLKLRNDISNVLLLPVDQRDEFIKSLPTILENYPDEVIASTLAPSLLSHSFLLIPSSAIHLMPRLLTPKSGHNDTGFFSVSVFREMILPLIVQLFSIYDAAIRKILLSQFQSYAHLFESLTLQRQILPQLLLGIKDTDDELVAKTLRCLATLIPILGADVVVGKNRDHIFATAKPKVKYGSETKKNSLTRKNKIASESQPKLDPQKGEEKLCSILETLNEDLPDELSKLPSATPEGSTYFPDIPERSSPDGGETLDDTLSAKVDAYPESPSEEQWSDWEEMLDQPDPEIIGVLQVKSPEVDALPQDLKEGSSMKENISKELITNNNSRFHTDSRSSSSSVSEKSSAMKLKSLQIPKSRKSQGLGEEYDIMSIKVEKKRDSELDLFADLKPNLLNTKDFNLEKMLVEASTKVRGKLPSVSDTLAELMYTSAEEGDEWNDEELSSNANEVLSKADLEEVPGKESIGTLQNSGVDGRSPGTGKLLLDEEGWGQENWDSF